MTAVICKCGRWAVHVRIPYEGWVHRWFPGPCPVPEARTGPWCPPCIRQNAQDLHDIGMGYPRSRAEWNAELLETGEAWPNE